MKKFLILGLFAALSFVACKNAETTPVEEAVEETVAPVEEAVEETIDATENAVEEAVAPAEAE